MQKKTTATAQTKKLLPFMSTASNLFGSYRTL